jgi:hypothetical protein
MNKSVYSRLLKSSVPEGPNVYRTKSPESAQRTIDYSRAVHCWDQSEADLVRGGGRLKVVAQYRLLQSSVSRTLS